MAGFNSVVILFVCVFFTVGSTLNFNPDLDDDSNKINDNLPEGLNQSELRDDGNIQGFHNMRNVISFLRRPENNMYQGVEMNDALETPEWLNDYLNDILKITNITDEDTEQNVEEINDILNQNDENIKNKEDTSDFNSDIDNIGSLKDIEGSTVDFEKEITGTKEETTTVETEFKDIVLDYNEGNYEDSSTVDASEWYEDTVINLGDVNLEKDAKKIYNDAKRIDLNRRSVGFEFFYRPSLVDGVKRVKRDDGIIFFDDSLPLMISRVDPFDVQSYSDAEKRCFNQEMVLIGGSCSELYRKGPCRSTEWVVIQRPSNKDDLQPLNAVCKPKPCRSNEDWWPEQNKCVLRTVAKRSYCGFNQEVTRDPYGDALCSCTEDYGSLENSNDCYEYYSQGSCPSGQVITYNDATGFAICAIDRCLEQNTRQPTQRFAPMNGDGQCLKLGSSEGCESSDWKFAVNRKTHVAMCNNVASFALNIADAIDKCRLNSNNMCEENIRVSNKGVGTYYLLEKKNQLKLRRKS